MELISKFGAEKSDLFLVKLRKSDFSTPKDVFLIIFVILPNFTFYPDILLLDEATSALDTVKKIYYRTRTLNFNLFSRTFRLVKQKFRQLWKR